MSSQEAGERPDTSAVIKGLKGFQRDTAEYAFERLYKVPIRRGASWWQTRLDSGKR